MSRFGEVIQGAAKQPIEAIQGIVAWIVLLFGLYIASPWYVSTTGGAIGQAFQDHALQQAMVGFGLYFFPALPIVLSFFFPRFNTVKWYSRSTFFMFIGLLFLTFLRLVTLGPFPLTWAFSFALALVMGVCHLYWKVK